VKNHDTPIICTLSLLSFVLCTLQSVPVARVCCTNIQPAFKLLVTMDLSSSSMIPFLIHSSINTGHPACLSFTFRICALSMVFSASSGALRCVKVDFHWSYCKSVDLICHRVSSIVFSHCLKSFGVRCKLAFWMNYFFSQSAFFLWNFLLSCQPSHCAEISCLMRQVSQYFATAPSSSTAP
jgi:hypothetical protein